MTRETAEKALVILGIGMFFFAVFGLIFMIGDALDIVKEHRETYALGAEVVTTSEYTEMFNDSFEGHIVKKDGKQICVMDVSGVKRTFEDRWLEAKE